jgi:hypothetical protein
MESDGEQPYEQPARRGDVDEEGDDEEPAQKGRASMGEVQERVGRNGKGEDEPQNEENRQKEENEVVRGVIQRLWTCLTSMSQTINERCWRIGDKGEDDWIWIYGKMTEIIWIGSGFRIEPGWKSRGRGQMI